MEALWIIIDIVEEDKRWRWCPRTSTIWWDQMVCMLGKYTLHSPKKGRWKSIFIVGYIPKIRSQGCTLSKNFNDYLF
jgi:hypothetical protein